MNKLSEFNASNDYLNNKYDFVIALYYKPTDEMGNNVSKYDLNSKALGYLNTSAIKDLNNIQTFEDLLNCLTPYHDKYHTYGIRDDEHRVYEDPKYHNCRMTKEEAEKLANKLQRCLNGVEFYLNNGELINSNNLSLQIKRFPKLQLGQKDYIRDYDQEEKDFQKWKKDRYDREVEKYRQRYGDDEPLPDYFNYLR